MAASSSATKFAVDSSNAVATFQQLLGSISVTEFFEKYWERETLHVQRGASEFYSGLFTKSAFDAHVRQHASELQYGFDLNICVCSDEGKKVDMNPPLKSAEPKEVVEKKSAAPAPSSKPAPPAKKPAAVSPPSSSAQSKPRSKSSKTSLAESEGVETMTIADALKLAAAQKAKLGRKEEVEEEEEEDDNEEEDDEDEDEAMDEENEEDEEPDSEDDDQDEEQLLDGTSVSTIKKYAPVTFAAYDKFYNSGCTVQALQPQQYTRSMWSLVSQLESFFGGLVGANCYLTPANSQGLAPHHDDVDVFVLQLEGTKTWKLYTPKMTLPREHSGDFAREELDEPFREVSLVPGDLMYLPRGVIHEARTSVADDSAHMTISVYQKTAWYDLLFTLFPKALEAAFYSSEPVRKGLPINYLSYMGTAGRLEQELAMQAEKGREASAAGPGEGLDPSQPKLSSQKLREIMFSQLDSLLTNHVLPEFQQHLDAACDQMAVDFMSSRLPPPPPPLIQKGKNPFASSSATKVDVGPEPTEESRVRLIHPSAVRMVVVPGDSDDEGENDEDEDSNGHLLLTHTLHNSAAHHLDGRFPPDPQALVAAQIQLPLYYAPAVMQLLRGGKSYRPLSSLQLDLDDMLNGEGEPPSSAEQVEAKLELVRTLWQAELLQVEEKRPAVAAASSPTNTAATNKQQKKRPASEISPDPQAKPKQQQPHHGQQAKKQKAKH